MRETIKWIMMQRSNRLVYCLLAVSIIGWFAGAQASLMQTSQNPHGDINLDCQLCHATDSWTRMRKDMAFDHDGTQFPLVGQHQQVACKSCHKTLKFADLTTNCFDCHTDVHENQFGDNCSRCHNPRTWVDETEFRVMHSDTDFPLIGVHATVDCQACHAEGYYASQPLECSGCHLDAYNSTDNPPHQNAGFPLDCGECHSVSATSWTGSLANFKHTESFPLVGGHATFNCQLCHQPGTPYSSTSSECVSCHLSDYEGANDPDHQSGNFGTNCDVCHSIFGWEPADFDHSVTDFPLTGGHDIEDCNACHSQGYTGTSKECITCHESDFNGATNPIHDPNSFDSDCEVCHTTMAWSPSTFDHNTLTEYALTGAHVSVGCTDCHLEGIYAGTPQICNGCHNLDYTSTTDPDHETGNYPTECDLCHTTETWADALFDHNLSSFPLTGAHTTVDCQACHTDGYTGTPTECFACHEESYTTAEDPLHTLPSFDHDCAVCHTTSAWEPSTFSHTTNTNYELTGSHIGLNCSECHIDGVYQGTPQLCYGCHQQDYEEAEDHVQENYPHECELCHNTTDWEGGEFNHEQTAFPLTGAHIDVDCNACHSEGYAGTPTDCFACHEDNFSSAVNPVHTSPSFNLDCTVCHTTAGWIPSTFDHNTATSYELTGAHLELNCALCHVDGQYAGTPQICYACHQPDYQGALDPDHAASNFPTDCELCHTTSGWAGATYDHNQSAFPLTGAHVGLECNACHSEGYTGTPTDCYACHQPDYQGVQDPDHVASNFPTDCELCHTTSGWAGATYDHDQSAFPLTGAHVGLDCNACHSEGYTGTPTDCYACHEDNFGSATNPIHTSPSFSFDCTVCHTTEGWSPSSFDHNSQTNYDLTGSHVTVACGLCHIAGQYAGTPTACFFCHEDDYQNATNPDHVSAGFPTTCDACHNTITWQDANFDHDNLYFPIYTGTHAEAWDACTDCHIGGNYNDFSCIDCHEHNQPDMDEAHSEVPGYVYASPACLNCHPNGSDIFNRGERRPEVDKNKTK